MKSVVITGVSSGIGFSGADILCQAGYRVYGSVRTEDEGAMDSRCRPRGYFVMCERA